MRSARQDDAVGGYRPSAVEFSILGPLEVSDADGSLEVSGPKERAVLAMLAASAPHVVSADRIVDALWGEAPPRSSGKAVQNLVLHLRRLLGPELIETRPGGYVLRTSATSIDARRFEDLVDAGRERAAKDDPAAAASAFSGALGLWRGPPLPELGDWPDSIADRVRLEELHRCAAEELADAELVAGRHRDSVARLETMVVEEPLRERRWVLLMTALYRSGRQADALRAFQRARAALLELGLEPGPELCATEHAVSVHDKSLDPTAVTSTEARELPTGVVTFLLTDVVDSAGMWERAPRAMTIALDRHDALIARAVTDAGGVVLKARGEGDSSFSVFSKTSGAILAALSARDALAGEEWPPGAPLAVRMAVHIGEANERDGDYYGPTVNRAARLRSVAVGGQIVLSESVASIVRDELPEGCDLAELGEHALRGLSRPERAFTLVPSGSVSSRDRTVVARSCPYMGLLAFQPEDDRLFFGRSELVTEVADHLRRSRFVALVGASGTGKSSLLRAGVVAGLRRSTANHDEHWITILMAPGSRPLAHLAAHLAPQCEASAAGLLHDLESDPRTLDVAIRQIVASQPAGTNVVLVVDQFEELFTLCQDEDERRRFVDALVDASSPTDDGAHLAIALRADFFGNCAAYDGLARLVGAHTELVGPMTDAGIRAAIEGPAHVAGLAVEPGLVELMVRDVKGEAGGLPLLSHALLEVWARRDGRTLTIDGYRASGGVTGAIGRTADTVYEALDDDERQVARGLFLRLTELGDGTEDTRRRTTLAELIGDDQANASRQTAVLQTLATARLVTVSDEGIDVAHEALIREWPRLRTWLDEDRDGLRIMRHVTDATHEWVNRGRDDSELYRGPRLDTALDWSGHHRDDLNPSELAFLDAGRGLRDAEAVQVDERARAKERSYRLLRRLLVGTAVALVMALVAGALAIGQRNAANTSRDRAAASARAEDISRLATLARTLPTQQTDIALLLALEAHGRAPDIETEGALESALVNAPIGLDQIIPLDSSSPSYSTYTGMSPDGHTIAVPLAHGVELMDVATGKVTRTVGTGNAGTALFSGDGRLVVTNQAGQAGVTVWDVATGRQVGAPISNAAPFASGLFDPADPSRLFVTAQSSQGGEVTEWDRSNPDQPTQIGAAMPFPVHALILPWATVSNDGTRLATGGSALDSTIVWDVATHLTRVLPGAPGAFLPGTHLLTTGGGDRIRVWDVETGEEQGAAMTGLTDAAGVDAVSADGRRLAAIDAGHGIRIFDLATRQPLGARIALDMSDTPVGFSADGRLVTSEIGKIALWRIGATVPAIATVVGNHFGPPDLTPVQGLFLPGTDDVMTQLLFYGHDLQRWNARTGDAEGSVVGGAARAYADVNGDGTLLAAPTADFTAVGVWDLRSGALVGLAPTTSPAVGAVWVPSTSMFATVQANGPDATLWDASDPSHPRVLGVIHAPPSQSSNLDYISPLFSGDGRLVAMAGDGGQVVTVFDVASRQPLWTRTVSASGQAAFSPDGRTLALQGSQVVTLYDARTGTPGRSFTVPGTSSTALEWARGGTALVTGSDLGASNPDDAPTGGAVAQLWDAQTLEPIGEPMRLDVGGNLTTIRNTDGSEIVTGSANGHAVVWDLGLAHWQATACRLAGRNLTRAEWSHYLPTEPYHVTCAQWPAGQ